MTPHIDEVACVEIGKMYWVPTVRYRWLHFGERDWPVIGPRHEDQAFIGFRWYHYHVDGRFLAPSIWISLARRYRQGSVWSVNGRPICDDDMPPVIRRRRCYRIVGWSRPGIFPELENHFRGQQCKRRNGAWVCPHKGARINNPPDENGVLTCPLHGLRIDAETGVVL